TFGPTDVARPEEIRRLMDRIGKERGKLHILCNNAGISLFRPLEELSVEEWDRVIHVNLRSVFLCAKYGLPLLRTAGRASIINIASTRALDRKSTRLNSSHVKISYAVFCLKKKNLYTA